MNSSSERVFGGMLVPRAYAKVVGRASFRSAPAVRRFAAAAMEKACRELACDLSECPGMDSTFTGVLAGIGLDLKAQPSGSLILLGLSPKLETGLRTLGLDRIATLCNSAAAAAGGVPEDVLAPLETGNSNGELTAQAVLDAHETLSSLSDENRATFENVVSCLRKDPQNPGCGNPAGG